MYYLILKYFNIICIVIKFINIIVIEAIVLMTFGLTYEIAYWFIRSDKLCLRVVRVKASYYMKI